MKTHPAISVVALAASVLSGCGPSTPAWQSDGRRVAIAAPQEHRLAAARVGRVVVAVVNRSGVQIDRGDALAVEAAVVAELTRRGFSVAARSDELAEALHANDAGLGATPDRDLARASKRLAAQSLAVISINAVQLRYVDGGLVKIYDQNGKPTLYPRLSIDADLRIIDVESSAVVIARANSEEFHTDSLTPSLAASARKLFAKVPALD